MLCACVLVVSAEFGGLINIFRGFLPFMLKHTQDRGNRPVHQDELRVSESEVQRYCFGLGEKRMAVGYWCDLFSASGESRSQTGSSSFQGSCFSSLLPIQTLYIRLWEFVKEGSREYDFAIQKKRVC